MTLKASNNLSFESLKQLSQDTVRIHGNIKLDVKHKRKRRKTNPAQILCSETLNSFFLKPSENITSSFFPDIVALLHLNCYTRLNIFKFQQQDDLLTIRGQHSRATSNVLVISSRSRTVIIGIDKNDELTA